MSRFMDKFKQPEKPKVLVCVLTGTERQAWINPELALLLFRMARDTRFDVEVASIKDAAPVEVARNQSVKIARDHGFDWLVSFDADNFMPAGTPLDIISAAGPEQSVIGLSYGVKESDSGYQIFPPGQSGRVDRLFREVYAVGGGVLMVNRRVWEKIPRGPWFRWMHGATETLDRDNDRQDGCGEDVYFCRLVQERGFKVWTHTQLLAGHYRTTDLTGMVCTMAQMAGAK